MRIGIFFPNWVGDAAMATPTIRALRRHFGTQASLIGVMRPYVAGVLEGLPWLDEEIYFAPHTGEPELRSWRVVQRLRQRRLDAAVLLTNSFRSALLAFASGARERVGYLRYGRGPLLTRRLTVEMQDRKQVPSPTVDYYLQLAYELGCPTESRRLELATLPVDEKAADLVWRQHGLRADRTVTLNCSGAYGGAKLWPVEYFGELAKRIVRQLDHDVLVLCGPQERMRAQSILAAADDRRVASLAGQPLSLGLSKACIRRSRLLITTDSGPRHFAVAFETPIVGLYGPTPPVWGENPTARERALYLDLDCFGCHQRTCPLGHHRCMRDLNVDRVFGAVRDELEKRPQRIAA